MNDGSWKQKNNFIKSQATRELADGIVILNPMTALAGDDLARACAESMYAKDMATQQVGITIKEVREGHAHLAMTIKPEMLNGHAICHGGFIFTLADTAFAYACNSRNRVNVAQKCHIEFKRPGRQGDELTAMAEHVSQDDRYGRYDVTVSDQNHQIIARFQGQSCEIEGNILD